MSETYSKPERSDKNAKQKEVLTMGQELYQTLQSLAGIVLIIIFLFTFVARVTVVDGVSMENTLRDRDIVLTWTLGYSPRQGDVVVLTKEAFREQSIIKRVIATEGQTVSIDYTTSTVYVDGEALDEPYIKEAMQMPWGETIDHVTVPEGHVFVMGDNRNDSSDSRLPTIGVVDERCIIGKGVLIMFPFADFGML